MYVLLVGSPILILTPEERLKSKKKSEKFLIQGMHIQVLADKYIST